MISSNPITVDGKVYNRLNFSLAITTRNEGGRYTAGAALTLTKFRVTDDGGQEVLDGSNTCILSGDTEAEMQSDTVKAAFISSVASAVQAYIDATGL